MEEDEENSIKKFSAVVKNIERYICNKSFILKDISPNTDVFDVTLRTKLRQGKFILHPSLNNIINRRLLKINSYVIVTKYNIYADEMGFYANKSVYIIKEIKVLDFEGNDTLPSDENFPVNAFFSSKPLASLQGYYMHFYINEECYGIIWKENNFKIMEPNILLSIDQLNIQYVNKKIFKPYHPVYGTVITKSRLTYYGKKCPTVKCPYLFSIEIESNGVSCSVSFWSTSCFSFFKSIKVGQVLVFKNYSIRKRYGIRSNTVFSCSKSADIELTINPENPEGEVGLSSHKPSVILYRFKTSLNKHKVVNEQIYDVVGVVVYIGRPQREIANPEKSESVSFWSFRWIELKTDKNGSSIEVKLYFCSQSNLMDSLMIGNIFIGTRLLCKIDVIEIGGKQNQYSYFTSTKESQFYKFDKDWKCEDLMDLPFSYCSEVIDVFLLTKDLNSMNTVLQNGYTGGWYSYPPLPDTLRGLKAFLSPDLMVHSLDDLSTLVKKLHFYQSTYVCVFSSIASVEVVQKNINPYICSQKVLNEKYSPNSTSRLTVLGNPDISQQDIDDFLGISHHNDVLDIFLRLYLVDDENKCIYVYFKPILGSKDCTFVEMLSGHSIMYEQLNNKDKFCKKLLDVPLEQRFLFYLDVYYYGNERTELVVNKAYVLPS
ncbi:RPA-related protein RADX isoform X1 [Hydra vulgaris]|uniref:RPA-related protein RADX isoform X1 n=1 Tax=Hydra vulgaris TaxID=6087 RepID=UPI001F5EB2E2|nr:RPA-related protein RADX isoform X1 [Hydra vulgaris]